MEKNLILKSQANEIFEEIQRRGLDPSQFQWEERDSELHGGGLLVSALIHRPTQYYFIFDRRYEERYTVRSPGRDTGIDKREVSSWVGQRQHVLEWLNCLKREIEAPDLWGAISQETKLAETASTSGASNTPFSPKEQEKISAQLLEIERYLNTTQNLTVEHTDFVKKRLNYLEEAAKRQGRQDWLHTTIGVLFTIVVGVGLSPEAARELFRFVTNTLRWLLGRILSLP